MAAIPLCEPIEIPVVRIEHDLLGDFALPADRYYGARRRVLWRVSASRALSCRISRISYPRWR